jgi:hypothetical protein
MLIKDNWAVALEPGIREWFFLNAERFPSMIPQLFDVQGSEKSAEHYNGIGAIGTDAWKQFKKTKVPATVNFDPGYKTTYTHDTFMVELPIERELIEDNQYPQIMDQVLQLSDSAMEVRETDGAALFNNAFTDTYAGADAVGLCSLVHPNGPNKTGTQANESTLALSVDNFASTRVAMQKFTDDVGGKLAINPDTVLVPPDLEDLALRITRSAGLPKTADNDVNPQALRTWNVIPWARLTDTGAWFMIDSRRMKLALKWFDRVPLDIYLKNQDASVAAVYVARMRYSLGWRDWRWVYGQNPS